MRRNRQVRHLALVSTVVALSASLGHGGAAAVVPHPIDPGRLPMNTTPAPLEPTQQRTTCTVAARGGNGPDVPVAQRDLGFESVWPLTRGAGQTVAVIDTGVAPHPRLPGLIAGGDYVATGDGIGDCDAHGTLVAGLIAAKPTPDSGFSGGAPDARIITIRQSSSNFSEMRRRADSAEESAENSRGYGNVRTMAMAVRRAADMGATVINISEVACRSAVDGIDDRDLGAAIHYAALAKDVVVVAAAGNVPSNCTAQNPPVDPLNTAANPWDSVTTIATPAWYDDHVLTVGSVNPDGSPSRFSLAGPWVDVAAPGTGITSLHPDYPGLANAYHGGESGPIPVEGTSFAAPYVAATAALVRSRFPHLTARQVMTRIEATAHASADGWNPVVGNGVIDPLAAVTAEVPLEGVPDDEPVSVAMAPPQPPPAPDHRPRTVAVAAAGGICALLALGVLASFPLRRLFQLSDKTAAERSSGATPS